jgi:hypothetical protein
MNDGPQPKETELDRINREIDAKVNEWHMHGWDPATNWGINTFMLSTRLDVLVDLMKEQLDMSDEDWAVTFGTKMLHNLTVCLDTMLMMQQEQQKPQIDVYRGLPHDIDGRMN